METQSEISRLTTREKECLRLWLEHKTAKEIARELGVSHHAIEKRLKMARTKLGVGSSLEAARLLAQIETARGYGQTATHSSDLSTKASDDQQSHNPPRNAAAKRRQMIMMTLSIALVMMVTTSQESAKIEGPSLEAALEQELSSKAEIARRTFERLDGDNSGYIEEVEFISPFSSFVFNKKNDAARSAGSINFEADAIHVAPFDQEGSSDKVLVTLDSSDTRRRRQIMFGLIDRNDDLRIDESELTSAKIEWFGTGTFMVQRVPADE